MIIVKWQAAWFGKWLGTSLGKPSQPLSNISLKTIQKQPMKKDKDVLDETSTNSSSKNTIG